MVGVREHGMVCYKLRAREYITILEFLEWVRIANLEEFGAILRLVAVLLLCFCGPLPGHTQTRTSRHLLPKTTPSPMSAGRPQLGNFDWVSPAKCEVAGPRHSK